VRRLMAGELAGAEKERTEAHVSGCARCARVREEILAEREALRRDVPFPQFAAAVAEKLAQRPSRSLVSRIMPLAAAAAFLLAAGTALVLRPTDSETVRSKGAPSARLFAKDATGVRELPPGAPVAAGARLLLTLHPAGRKQAAAVLLEPGETNVLYQGTAVNGPLPQAFEWTRTGSATLLIIFSDAAVDAPQIRSAKDAPRGADVVQIKLHR